MAEGRITFDVQVFGDEHWTSVAQHPTLAAAQAAATKLFAAPACPGVRVVQEGPGAGGKSDETVVFSEIREAPEANLTIVAIDDPHLCSDFYDFYGHAGRMSASRLFRKYVERVFLSPTEILHNYRALQNIQAFGNLLQAGVERVAMVQGKLPGQSAMARREVLYDVATRMIQRVRAADSLQLPALHGNDFAAVVDGVAGREDYHALVVLSRDLVQHRSWLGKFERLAAMTGPEPREDVVALIDGVIADLFYLPGAFDDIVGFQRNLGQLLCSIADIHDGSFDGSRTESKESLAVFMPLLAAGRMPQTREALLDRVARQVVSTQPLDRLDPGREREAFRAVAGRLRRGDKTLGGHIVAEALGRREAALFGPGGMPPSEPPAKAIAVDQRELAAQLAALAAEGAKVTTYPAGSVVFKEGAAPDSAYMVVSGQVEIVTVHRKKHVLLAQLGPDAIFGELALFSAIRRTATAITVGGCQLRIIDKPEMDKRIEALDPFCRYWVQYLVSRVTDLSGRVAASSSKENAS